MSFMESIRERGVLQLANEKFNELVTRLTTGMDVQDTRSVLRGDSPGRPNPRVKPHTESFWFHIRPTFYHKAITKLYPTFRLGFLSGLLFAVEIVTGVFLMVFYTPSPDAAYGDMLNILSNVPFGKFVRDIHRLGAELMVIVVVLHMARTFLTASYKKPRQFTWSTGVVLLLITLFLSFSGYLLPWDQLAFWAVTIGTSMAEAAPPPQVGEAANLLLRGAPDIGAGGLLRFYLLHVIFLPLTGLLFFSVHYYKVIRHGHSLPPDMEEVGEDTARRVKPEDRINFLPDIFANELLWVGIVILAMVVVVMTVFEAPLESHADPNNTPLHSKAPWYFYWLQGLLKDPVLWILGKFGITLPSAIWNSKIILGLALPTLLGVVLLFLPYLDRNPSRRYKDRRVALAIGGISAVLLVWLSLGGTPGGDPLTGFGAVEADAATEVGQSLIPQEGVGPVRAIPYEELLVGDYDLATAPWESVAEASPELAEVLEEYDHLLREQQDTLPNANGLMLIEQWQADLRKISLRITWDGMPQAFTKSTYIHADSDYAGE
jgi:quinol-cytochrome oxidoreductase complex cytochrome b subunit